MTKVPATIPEELHFWVDYGLTNSLYEVINNDESLVCCMARFATGQSLYAAITYATERRLLFQRAYLVFAVCELDESRQAKKVHLTDQLQVRGRDGGGMMFEMAMRAKLTAMIRAVADVLGYGAGIPFRRTAPVERTAAV